MSSTEANVGLGLGARPVLTVLQQFNAPTPKTNPYLIQLLRALEPMVRVQFWSLRRALLTRYDVVHLHWPEYTMRHSSALGRLLRQAAVALLLLRWTLMRTPVVRTLHNLEPHERGGVIESVLLRWMDRLVVRWIRINATTEARLPATDTVLHGHYRDWFGAQSLRPVLGRLLHFGLIRPYKGVEVLLDVMAGLADSGLALRIVGNPSDAAMRELVERKCDADSRVSALLQYVDDATLAREVAEAELVVLPYREMHNSGTLLLALSLSRPVLVPRTGNNEAVSAEVGEGWVLMYDGELSPEVVEEGLRRARALGGGGSRPDLSRREWLRAGQQHYRTYAAAIRARRARGRNSGMERRRVIASKGR